KPPSPDAKLAALRLLSADAGSAALFEKVLRDKDEAPATRQMSAAALHAMAPAKLQSAARAIVLDKDDDHEVQATSLTALTNFGAPEALGDDAALHARVGELVDRSPSKKVKEGANHFLAKFRG